MVQMHKTKLISLNKNKNMLMCFEKSGFGERWPLGKTLKYN